MQSQPQPQLAAMLRGQMFEGFLLVKAAEQRTSSNGGKYLDMTLADRSGEVNAKMWDGAAAAPKALKHPEDYDARAQLMWAGTIAHNETVGVGRVGDWASHKIEHELSARYGVAHGAGLAVVLPAWMRHHLAHDPARFAQLAVRVWGCEADFRAPEATGLAGIERFEAFLRSIGMPGSLKELGGKSEDIPALAASTRKEADGGVGNYTHLFPADIEAILRIADK